MAVTPTHKAGRRLGRATRRRAVEAVVRTLIYAAGLLSIVILAAIAIFLVVEARQSIGEIGLDKMLSGTQWFPTGTPKLFGFLPLIVGTLAVTGVAVVVFVPIGIGASVFISEFSAGWFKEGMKSVIEFMAAVPSVVYGFLGVAVVIPWVKATFSLTSGMTALTGGLVLGIMSLPTVISISEDALHAVPDALRQGSLALGNTRWQTVYKVVVPSASSGIFAGVMLGLGRAIGETMAVLMLTGNAAVMPTSVFESVRTMTGTIAAEMGEVVYGGQHYSVLFSVGLVLFAITFLINLAADLVLERQRKRWRR
ncbi:MAG: phosphate ABC transporter permease subunit PstC [Actinobacteria bacterium HGW-Actinobacteria-6]|nr:MAG: phosphate ABC transporter permease subunit PstC [Actinobacteria bacterium HGW-Actinobacteria-6]